MANSVLECCSVALMPTWRWNKGSETFDESDEVATLGGEFLSSWAKQQRMCCTFELGQ